MLVFLNLGQLRRMLPADSDKWVLSLTTFLTLREDTLTSKINWELVQLQLITQTQSNTRVESRVQPLILQTHSNTMVESQMMKMMTGTSCRVFLKNSSLILNARSPRSKTAWDVSFTFWTSLFMASWWLFTFLRKCTIVEATTFGSQYHLQRNLSGSLWPPSYITFWLHSTRWNTESPSLSSAATSMNIWSFLRIMTTSRSSKVRE